MEWLNDMISVTPRAKEPNHVIPCGTLIDTACPAPAFGEFNELWYICGSISTPIPPTWTSSCLFLSRTDSSVLLLLFEL